MPRYITSNLPADVYSSVVTRHFQLPVSDSLVTSDIMTPIYTHYSLFY